MWEMYYIENYYAFMIGLLEVESALENLKRKNLLSKEQEQYLLDSMKHELKEWYIEYCNKEHIFYIESELTEEIMKFHIIEDWSETLVYYHKVYEEKQIVKDILDKVHEMKKNIYK